jgi:hypothetical protein
MIDYTLGYTPPFNTIYVGDVPPNFQTWYPWNTTATIPSMIPYVYPVTFTQTASPELPEPARDDEASADLTETIREMVREEIAAFKKDLASEVIKTINKQLRLNTGNR